MMEHLKCFVVNIDDIDQFMEFHLQLIFHDDDDDDDIYLVDGLVCTRHINDFHILIYLIVEEAKVCFPLSVK